MIINQTPYPISFEREISQALTCRYGEEMRQYIFKPDVNVSGLSCLLQIAKPDGTFTENGVEVHTDPDTGECTLVITIPQQATVVKGVARYSICCYGEVETETHLLYSAEGLLWVDDDLITEEMIQSVAEVNGMVFPQDFVTIDMIPEIAAQVLPEVLPAERGFYLRASQDTGDPEWSAIDMPYPGYGPSDAGKSLTVNADGTDVEWEQINVPSPLPVYGPSDAGKALTVNAAGTDVEWQKMQHIYSTQEHVVGTWIDGRNVYERTYEVNTTTPLGTNSYAFNHGITDLDRVINYYGSSYWPGGAGGKMIPFSDSVDSIYVTLYNNNVIGMYLSDGMKSFGGAYYIIITIQYIKTS